VRLNTSDGRYLHVLDIDIRLVQSIEQNNSLQTNCMKLVYHVDQVGKIGTDLGHEGNGYSLPHLLQNIEITLLERSGCSASTGRMKTGSAPDHRLRPAESVWQNLVQSVPDMQFMLAKTGWVMSFL
jgi:hypothetical protein